MVYDASCGLQKVFTSLPAQAMLLHKSNVEQNFCHCEQSEAIQSQDSLFKVGSPAFAGDDA